MTLVKNLKTWKIPRWKKRDKTKEKRSFKNISKTIVARLIRDNVYFREHRNFNNLIGRWIDRSQSRSTIRNMDEQNLFAFLEKSCSTRWIIFALFSRWFVRQKIAEFSIRFVNRYFVRTYKPDLSVIWKIFK